MEKSTNEAYLDYLKNEMKLEEKNVRDVKTNTTNSYFFWL